MTITNDLLKRIAFAILGLGLIGYGLWLQSGGRNALTSSPTPVANTASATAASDDATLVKVPIKDMRVGTRVPASNPEVSAAARRAFTEPNWYQWVKLKLEMPKPDGTMLEIEMLRPEDWLIEQVTLVVEPIPVMLSGLEEFAVSVESPSQSNAPIASAPDTDLSVSTGNQESFASSPIGIPLRPIYTFLSDRLLEAAANREEVLGMVVELDLPELGISGPAWIVDMEPAPLVPAGPGQVVTATFKHASANVLDLVLTNAPPTTLSTQTSAHSNPGPSPSALSSPPSTLSDAPTDSIGVTANHPFWSVDRAEFVQAGELQIGERLLTLAGDINWVQQKLPRPGPEPVFNLEVHDEHVYYVGTNGILAHNSKGYSRNSGKAWQQINRYADDYDDYINQKFYGGIPDHKPGFATSLGRRNPDNFVDDGLQLLSIENKYFRQVRGLVDTGVVRNTAKRAKMAATLKRARLQALKDRELLGSARPGTPTRIEWNMNASYPKFQRWLESLGINVNVRPRG